MDNFIFNSDTNHIHQPFWVVLSSIKEESENNIHNLVLTGQINSDTVNTIGNVAVGYPTNLLGTTDTQACPNYFSYTSNTDPSKNIVRPLQGGIQISYPVADQIPSYKILSTMTMICVDNNTNSVVGLVYYSNLNSEEFCSNWDTPTYDPPFGQGFTGNDNDPAPFIGILKKTSLLNRRPKFNNVFGSLITIDYTGFSTSVSWKPYGLSGVTDYLQFASTAEIDNLQTSNMDLLACCGGGGVRGQGTVKLRVCGQGEFKFTMGTQFGEGPSINLNDIFFYQASGVTTPPGYVCAAPSFGFCAGEPLIVNFDGIYKYVGITLGGLFVGTAQETPYQAAVAIRMDKIANYLNISPYTGQTVNFSDINNVQYIYENDLTSGVTKTLSGNTYWQGGTYKISLTPLPTDTPTPTITPSITLTNSSTPTQTPTITTTPSITPTQTNTLPLVTDYDGNTYEQIIIGNRVWLGGNMKTTHYNNGDIIPYRGYLSGNTEPFCSFSGEGAWMYTKLSDNFPEDPNYNQTAGKLYNYYTITDVRGICPVGFRPADTGDWYNLSISLGGGINGGQSPSNFYPINGGLNGALAPYTGFSQQIKSTLNPPYGWTILASEPIPTNSSNFSAYPSGGIYAGIEDTCNPFFNGNNECWWWTNSSNFYLPDTINYVYLGGTVLGGDSAQPNSALCIRCVRDLV